MCDWPHGPYAMCPVVGWLLQPIQNVEGLWSGNVGLRPNVENENQHFKNKRLLNYKKYLTQGLTIPFGLKRQRPLPFG